MPFTLNPEEKNFLLQLARNAIQDSQQSTPAKKKLPLFSGNLKTHTGVFVTLEIKGELRGCIGYVKGYKPLQEAVAELAVSAAFNDPRFPPLSPKEFAEIEIEISVLTPLERVNEISEIEIGRDGLLIKRGYNEGLLLPQVATEYGWDVESFLNHTCRKANLPMKAWTEDTTEIYRFSALIFKESAV